MSNEWTQRQQDDWDFFQDMVKQYDAYWVDTVMPAFMVSTGPEKELEEFNSWTPEKWADLEQNAPDLYPKLSDRALTLREREQKKSLADWQREQFVMQRAFMPQLQPFGLTPQREFEAGLNEPLPLQRTG